MPCDNFGNLSRSNVAISLSVRPWDFAIPSNNRYLIVSNQPETIGAVAIMPQNLYKCELTMPVEGSIHFRVFLWHGNASASPKFLLLVAETVGSGATLTAHRSVSRQADLNDLDNPGICCAKGQVVPALDPDSGYTLDPSTPKRIAYYEIGPANPDLYQGAIHEFTITGAPAGTPVRIRTVWSTSATSLGQYSASVIAGDPQKPHPRGFWPYSDIIVSLFEAVDVALSESGIMLPCGAAGGGDSELFRKRDDDPYGFPETGNKGLYGVNANYSLGFVNSQPTVPKKIAIYFKPGGGKFWGAIQAPTPGIPVLHDGTTEVVYFGTYEVGHLTVVDAFTLAVGGAAATPVNRCFVW